MESAERTAVGLAFGATRTATQELVSGFGLPYEPEIVELVEIGLQTFSAAYACGRPEIAADYLNFASARVEALRRRPCEREDVTKALHALVETQSPTDQLDAWRAFLADVLVLVTWSAPPEPSGAELSPLARQYLALTLEGRRDEARAVARDAVRRGATVASVLMEVLEPAQREIGRLWQLGEISVAQEHYCTAVTQLVMSDLEPLLFTGVDNGNRLVAVDAPGSLHQVGLRMVVDLLECEGWNTTYHGPTDPRGVPDLVHAHDAAVLAISLSMPAQIEPVSSMISAVRADPRTQQVKVLVGGRPFLVAPELVAAVGADAWAPDAVSAVTICSRLVAEPR